MKYICLAIISALLPTLGFAASCANIEGKYYLDVAGLKSVDRLSGKNPTAGSCELQGDASNPIAPLIGSIAESVRGGSSLGKTVPVYLIPMTPENCNYWIMIPDKDVNYGAFKSAFLRYKDPQVFRGQYFLQTTFDFSRFAKQANGSYADNPQAKGVPSKDKDFGIDAVDVDQSYISILPNGNLIATNSSVLKGRKFGVVPFKISTASACHFKKASDASGDVKLDPIGYFNPKQIEYYCTPESHGAPSFIIALVSREGQISISTFSGTRATMQHTGPDAICEAKHFENNILTGSCREMNIENQIRGDVSVYFDRDQKVVKVYEATRKISYSNCVLR